MRLRILTSFRDKLNDQVEYIAKDKPAAARNLKARGYTPEPLRRVYILKKKGTPQEGVISPTIMNMVLNGMEGLLKKHFPRWMGQKVNFIQYADDFVITASTYKALKYEVIPLVKDFLSERGLTLSKEKSKITHINDGYDFLSQNIRKIKGKLLIRPSRSLSCLSKIS